MKYVNHSDIVAVKGHVSEICQSKPYNDYTGMISECLQHYVSRGGDLDDLEMLDFGECSSCLIRNKMELAN